MATDWTRIALLAHRMKLWSELGIVALFMVLGGVLLVYANNRFLPVGVSLLVGGFVMAVCSCIVTTRLKAEIIREQE